MTSETHSIFHGRALCYGNDINTDVIIAGKYTKTLDYSELARHVLEDLDPDFHQKFTAGDIIVAGRNFGCGSSREQAPLALKTVGVSCIIAVSFARIFYRNAINIGLPVIECKTSTIESGDQLRVDLQAGTIANETRGEQSAITPLPEIMQIILRYGGIISYLKEHGHYPDLS